MQAKEYLKHWEILLTIAIPLLSQVSGINGKLLQYLNKLNGQPLSHILGAIIIVLFWLLILSVAWLVHLFNKVKLKPHFGLYWDKKKNPYCPICKKLILSGYHNKPLDPHFTCLKCNIKICLRDERGNQMHLYQAVDFLNVKKITSKLIEKSKQKGKYPYNHD